MKKIFLFVCIVSAILTGRLFAQIQFKIVGEEVKLKRQYVFNITSNGWGSEIVINNKAGNVLLTFIPFKIQDGWVSFTNTDKSGTISRSGTSYTYFYRVAEPSGSWCDIPSTKLWNMRNVARYVIMFALVKAEALDKVAFDQFCTMHGRVYDNLKYFK